MVGGERNLLVGFCRNCSPLNGEDIRGVVTRGRGIKVHRLGCRYLRQVEGGRIFDARWDAGAVVRPRPVQVRVICDDSPGMLARMSRAISSSGVNIGSVDLRRVANGQGLARFEVMLSSMDELEKITQQLQMEDGVFSVSRG